MKIATMVNGKKVHVVPIRMYDGFINIKKFELIWFFYYYLTCKVINCKYVITWFNEEI